MVTLKGVIGSPHGIVNGKSGEVDVEKEKVRLSELRRNKVVLVIGASRGIGFNVVKQYASESGTVVIAASSSMGKHFICICFRGELSRLADILRKSIISLGDTLANIQCEEVNLTWSHQKIADRIRIIDKRSGPITHLFEVGGLSNNVQDWGARGLVRFSFLPKRYTLD